PRRVIVRAAPSAAAPAIVLVGRRGGGVFSGGRLAERDGGMRVAVAGEQWALDGWVERRQLANLDSTIAGGSTCACAERRMKASVGAPGVKPRYQGPARIAA